MLPVLAQAKNLKILDLVRDPRGIYKSNVFKGMIQQSLYTEHLRPDVRHDIPTFANPRIDQNQSVTFIQSLCRHFMRKPMRHESVLLVRFEDLIGSGGRTARAIFDFLGLEVDEQLQQRISELSPAGPLTDTQLLLGA